MKKLLGVIVVFYLLYSPLYANEKIALVIGNNQYTASPLKNPVNDAKAIGNMLKSLGYNLIEAYDANKAKLDHVLDEFGKQAEKADIAIVYYAGHAIQVNGNNYFVPANTQVKERRDLRKLLNMQSFVDEAGYAKRLGLVIVDACRDNPFYSSLSRKLTRGSVGRGLARIEQTQGNTLIAFATKEGAVAQDGDGKHSPYAKALLNNLNRKNTEINLMFGQIRDDVMTLTRNAQQPYTYGSLGGQAIYLAGMTKSNTEEENFWQSMQQCGSRECIQAYLDRFPSGQFQVVAKQWLHDHSAIPLSKQKKEAFEPQMLSIKGGCYMMGSPKSEKGRKKDEHQHRVCIDDFSIAKTEVTFKAFQLFIKATGYITDAERNLDEKSGCYLNKVGYTSGKNWQNIGEQQTENHPVVCISWNDAVAYSIWLSKETGRTYRLPTEAEWEFAARAGSKERFYFGADENSLCDYANIYDITLDCRDGAKNSAPVGSYRANDYGLKDMIGNVWEWTCSGYDKKYTGAERLCARKGDSNTRVLRGGGWVNSPARLRSATRLHLDTNDSYFLVGFRIVEEQ